MLKIKKKRIVIPYRPVIKWLVKLRRSPRAIAGGFALGTLVAFTPTMGIQFFIVMFLATILNMNRPAAFVTIWITNIATFTPIYTFNYWLGSKVWDGPPLSEVSGLFIDIGRTMARLEFWDIKEQFLAVLQMGKEILFPLLLGSIAIGVVTGFIVYALSLKLLSVFFIRRYQRRLLNNRKDK